MRRRHLLLAAPAFGFSPRIASAQAFLYAASVTVLLRRLARSV